MITKLSLEKGERRFCFRVVQRQGVSLEKSSNNDIIIVSNYPLVEKNDKSGVFYLECGNRISLSGGNSASVQGTFAKMTGSVLVLSQGKLGCFHLGIFGEVMSLHNSKVGELFKRNL